MLSCVACHREPALAGVWLGHLQRSFPTTMTLWFCVCYSNHNYKHIETKSSAGFVVVFFIYIYIYILNVQTSKKKYMFFTPLHICNILSYSKHTVRCVLCGNCWVMTWTTVWAPEERTWSVLEAQVKAIQLCDQKGVEPGCTSLGPHLRANCCWGKVSGWRSFLGEVFPCGPGIFWYGWAIFLYSTFLLCWFFCHRAFVECLSHRIDLSNCYMDI